MNKPFQCSFFCTKRRLNKLINSLRVYFVELLGRFELAHPLTWSNPALKPAQELNTVSVISCANRLHTT